MVAKPIELVIVNRESLVVKRADCLLTLQRWSFRMFSGGASHGSPRVSECQSAWKAGAAAVLPDEPASLCVTLRTLRVVLRTSALRNDPFREGTCAPYPVGGEVRSL